ncbi:hypothetical protein SEA_EMIANNA_58 [Gordonia phage Emianna]|uniref:Uncharacterized protein n=4 Tax=Foxborovirus TaxID=2948710 RepID=A0A385UCE5_9CAUD|nr:hypothetical protein KNT99_gp58 [Gordonia phage NatB6]YP_010098315.1 hypothetical protein KNU10_gp59 [Gordonia phage Foxboro]YP_010098406.1 hypothetical protein KNU11_gp58 [Gordonia phage KidneyBean]YP_010098946.1 hypothetical protein KNU15_gp58 [Gordonia phage Emianna]AYD84172.1 hypothetical protein SEA_JIFALL16_57 [Gordonia phage Jifall16]AYD84330.1 hypothetical protein SEA_KURT_58 [Gordonia phage Kurt]QOP66719.1 hypothetical protein SEA_NOVUMREGINA_58 [Gordonia phage NovumRegina]QOR559
MTMPTKVVVTYDLQSLMGPRSVTAYYQFVGDAFRVPAVGERIRKDGRVYNVYRVTWDLDSPPMEQEVTVSAQETME